MSRLLLHWSRQKQQALVLLCAALLPLAVALALLLPIHKALDRARQELAATQRAHAQASALVAELQSLNSVQPQPATAAADLTAVLTASLQAYALQPSRLQGNDNEVQLRLDAVQYATLMAWLASLEQTPSVRLVNVALAQGSADTVNANVSFRGI